jgi:acyl carrier protein
MQRDQLISEVISVVTDAVNLHHLNRAEIHADVSLRAGGLELDSVDILETVVAIEQHFGVKVADAETGMKYFKTIGTIAEFIQLSRSTG